MFKKFSVLIIFNFIFLCTAIHEKKPWTFFTYIAADNDLAEYVQQDLDEMVKGYNENMHVAVFLSTKNSQGKWSQKLYITKDGLQKEGEPLFDLDSGSAQTAIDAVSWVLEQFPSDHLVMNFWDHGSGIKRSTVSFLQLRGVCFDDTTGNYLTDYDLMRILQYATQKLNKKVDIVSFDACLMGALEIAAALQPYASYMVASEEVIAAYGFQYAFVFNKLLETSTTPGQYAQHLVRAYNKYYHAFSSDYTLSAVNLSKLPVLLQKFDSLIQQLVKLLASNADQGKIIKQALFDAAFGARAIRFENPDYLDLVSFFTRVNKYIQQRDVSLSIKRLIDKNIKEFLYSLQRCVIDKAFSPRFSLCGGLSIYFPLSKTDSSYHQIYWPSKQSWINFIDLVKY